MRKTLLLLAGVAVLSVPAVSIASGSSSKPSAHPAKSETPEVKKDKSNPAKICRSKVQGAGSNAFGKCVSLTAKDQDKSAAKHGAKSDSQDSNESDGKDSAESNGGASPAMTCKTTQANDPTHFEKSYGTRPNAFGKCVSGHANSNKS